MKLTRILLPCLFATCLPMLAACGGDDSDGACRSGHGGSGGFGGHNGFGGGMGGGGMAGGGFGGGFGGGGGGGGMGGMHHGMRGDDTSSSAPCPTSSHAKGKAPTRMREVTPDQATIGDEQH
ncbi:hypothetical protein [Gluconacetobacter tumulicola]|uniref:hypothetical protein n=1 Tax=Gluconacetobacter tumulicola TaxID=1017177 RepID=UPI001601D537|nr:hypothetical protein [Gluconacetobacter tumulicola]